MADAMTIGTGRRIAELEADLRHTEYALSRPGIDSVMRTMLEIDRDDVRRLLAEGAPMPERESDRIRRLADATKDAYSYALYGRNGWLQCVKLLASRGYDDREIEAILRSKWMQWAADRFGAGGYGLKRFMDENRNGCTPQAIRALVAQTFDEVADV